MIYKFYKGETGYSLEVELFNELNQSKEINDNVSFSIIEDETDQFYEVCLTKQDIFKLIGALHLLHKEMK